MRIISGKARGTKLNTLEGEQTRPTLDRVKESIFNIIQNELEETVFVDIFSGSGAIGLEALSRGAKKAILCDKSREAIAIIKSNVEKTHFQEKAQIINADFEKCLKEIKEEVDYIYIDPPYKTDYILKSLKILEESEIIKEETKIILETDDEERILKQIESLKFDIIDKRKYGIAHIIFLKKKSNS
ncbi:MAG: 16S rRNA (guanine(966)-N(2))-methyltransferase RsmD [Clostridia bacterium]|nr:16S rRNA (guanine(966)-N(2))-methyltransferase RsmD [Clostridia bacterium]